MTCRHDPLYLIENEAAGGAGCPMCAAERRKAHRPHIVMVAVDTDDELRPGWIDSNRDVTPLSDLADRVALAYKESELKDYEDWPHIKGDCAL